MSYKLDKIHWVAQYSMWAPKKNNVHSNTPTFEHIFLSRTSNVEAGHFRNSRLRQVALFSAALLYVGLSFSLCSFGNCFDGSSFFLLCGWFGFSWFECGSSVVFVQCGCKVWIYLLRISHVLCNSVLKFSNCDAARGVRRKNGIWCLRFALWCSFAAVW